MCTTPRCAFSRPLLCLLLCLPTNSSRCSAAKLTCVRCSCPQQAQEALRRAKFKFAGRQKIVVSRNWGFTKFARADYVAWKKAGRLINDGVNAKVRALS